MIEFWEHNFKEKQTMWEFEPAESAIIVKDFEIYTYKMHKIKKLPIFESFIPFSLG